MAVTGYGRTDLAGSRRLAGRSLLPLVLVGSVLGSGAGCGPTCESACEKTFDTCQLRGLNPGETVEQQVENCIAACGADLKEPAHEGRAVGWIGCIEAFECDPSDQGLDLCLACESGYYLGQVSGAACRDLSAGQWVSGEDRFESRSVLSDISVDGFRPYRVPDHVRAGL